MKRNDLNNRAELNEQLKAIYGWYAAMAIEEMCHVRADELIASMHRAPLRIVQNINDGKDYYIIDYQFNRMNDENTGWGEIGTILYEDYRKLEAEVNAEEDETRRTKLWDEVFSNNALAPYTKWVTAWDLYDAGRLQLALDNEILGSLNK